jgi:hypothetical protein
MTGSEYESLVQDLIRKLKNDIPPLSNAIVNHGKKNSKSLNLILGKSGYRHQIDVSLSTKDHLILIECKCLNRLIGVAEMLVLASRLADIRELESEGGREVSALIISKKGASGPAIRLSRHFVGVAEPNIVEVSGTVYDLKLLNYTSIGLAETR